ncbi:nucleoside diphosphate kinase regulator [Noviherbaspirillum sp.]|uniref:nucleoside diphosphate kinase regulator n=1 Tax=Noviherbaspirillum sp. TaxID=1926288 RepID=UPI002FDFBA9A
MIYPINGHGRQAETKPNADPAYPIVMSTLDHLRISELMNQTDGKEMRSVSLLEKKLRNADVVVPQDIPECIVTMNSQVLFLELGNQAVYGFTLVYPNSTSRQGDVSILSPVGAALLGLSTGQETHWWSAKGRRFNLRVLELVYQPEAAGLFSL